MMRWAWVIAALLWLGVPGTAAAQQTAEAWFTAESGSAPLVGEPVTLALSARLPAGAVITRWPDFPQQWPPFEVVEAGELRTTARADGGLEARQELTVMLWTPGDYSTPETRIGYQLPGEAPLEIAAAPVFFTVPSAVSGEPPVLRPLKPQAALSAGMLPLTAAGVAVGAGALALVGIVLRRRRGPRPAQTGPLSAYALALAGLRSIAEGKMPEAQVYAGVTEHLRAYISSRLALDAADLTTAELIETLADRIPGPAQQELSLLLERADLVKFARYRPGPRSAQLYVGLAQRWVKTVERALAQPVSRGEDGA
jgi:hypothetical protein